MTTMISMGSDPELFLEDANGKVISAIGKIGGTKSKPRALKELGRGYYVQEDNVLLEYNTPIAKSRQTWLEFHVTITQYLAEMVGQLGLKLSTKASHSMDPDQMDHPQAFVFGCEPDFDVWAMEWNKKPAAADPLLRSAGGHIHVAYNEPNPVTSVKLARIMDYLVGAPLALIDPDVRRRELYGKPGAIRFKKYGLEYRTPSNFWTLDQDRIEKVFYAVKNCFELLNSDLEYGEVIATARPFLAGETKDFDRSYLQNFGAF